MFRVDIMLMWPVDEDTVITQRFGEHPEAYAQFGLAGHNGIDFGVPNGTPINAAANGKVTAAGPDANGYGIFVKIDHGAYQTIYGHLKNWNAWVGSYVNAGTMIGTSNNTGNSTGPHLHFELRIPGDPHPGYLSGACDPLPYLTSAPVHEIVPGCACLVTATGGLHLRYGADVATKSMALVKYKTPVTVTKLAGDWVEVEMVGYMYKSYLARKL